MNDTASHTLFLISSLDSLYQNDLVKNKQKVANEVYYEPIKIDTIIKDYRISIF